MVSKKFKHDSTLDYTEYFGNSNDNAENKPPLPPGQKTDKGGKD